MNGLPEPAKVLTIGGSDSGGAAGIQADLKCFTALGVYGMSALTAVTAQNSLAVEEVAFLSPALVLAQVQAVLGDYGAAAVKTGFIGRAELVQKIAGTLAGRRLPLVVDPVLVNHRGEAMFSPEVTAAYCRHLLPLASLITPNRQEAALLAELPVESEAGARLAAARLHALGAAAVLIKAIPQGEELLDLFSDGRQVTPFRQRRLETANTHGAGDTLSAAVAAFLARGEAMPAAVAHARRFTLAALEAAAAWHLGRGHGPLAPWAARLA